MKILSKKVKFFGRSIPAVAIALIAIAALASAGLLSYYGMITGTATVSQSVLVDRHKWNELITYTYSGVAGSTVVDGPHTLKNNAQVPAKISFETSCCNRTGQCGYGTGAACEGITTTYLEPVSYSFAQNFCGLGVTVQEETVDGAKWLKWTYTFAENPTHTPKMTVAINYPNGYAITTFDDGSHNGWYYAPDGGAEVRFADYSGGTYEDWVKTTASGSILNVSIKESKLPDSFHWHGYGNYNGNQVWIGGPGAVYCGSSPTYGNPPINVTIRQPLTSPVTLQPAQELSFWIVNSFQINLVPDEYTITTSVVPVTQP